MVEYLIKSSLILAVLWVFYKLFLEKESFFAANRVYLVACIVLTFLLPFVSLPQLIDDQGFISVIIETADNPASLTSDSQRLLQTPPDITAPDNEPAQTKMQIVDWLLWLYYFGVGIFAINFFIQVVSLLIKAGKSTDQVHDDDAVIISHASVKEPYSFFRYIFIDPERYDYETYEQILAHEKIHAKRLHAADLMLGEVAVILLWFNPLAWILRKEIDKNIEYETDNLMVKENEVDKEAYQMNLLKIATHTKPLAITTNYNQSLITQRILRMNAKKSNLHSYWKYAFTAPLLLAMLVTINKPIPTLAIGGNESGGSGSAQDVAGYSDGCQSLLRAVKKGDVEEVRELLKTVDPDCTYRGDGEPRSPLVAAARKGNLLIGRLLIEAGADVEFHAWGDETPLMAASAHGHLDFVKHLLTGNADINRKLGGDGSALLVAARQGHLEIVKHLISHGADVNSQVNGDGTPLICSVRNNHYEVSRVLLENGADPFLVSPGDEYAMYHARMSGNKALIELLEKYDKRN